MLPKINVISTLRKSNSLNKGAFNKILSPSLLNYINSTQSKSQTMKSPQNKLSENLSKTPNISTKNNTSSNSNFYENLFYYPPHKKTFSYINNLSSKVNFIYGDFNFNQAPSLRQNFSGIRKIIKNKRSSKIKYLDNLFSQSIYGNKLSHSISAQNITSKENNTSNVVSINHKISGNNSYEDFIYSKKEKMEDHKSHRIIKNIKSEKKKNIGCKTITSKETISNNIPITNQETIRFPELSSKEENNDIKAFTTRYQKTNSFITDLNTKKIHFNINDCIFENNGKIKNVSAYAQKILHIKIFQGFQKNILSNFSEDKIKNLKKYINNIETNFQKYMNICKEYDYNYLIYIKFLKKKIIEMIDEEKALTRKEIQLEFEIDDIITENIRIQGELEKLIDMRNFLYIVRHKDEKIPDIYSTFYIESKRYLLAQLFIKLCVDFNNITVMKYLLTVPKPIPDLTSMDSSKFIVEQTPPLIKDMNNINYINSKESIDNNSNIFASPKEFINTLKFIEEQNKVRLRINEDQLDSIERYKEILEKIVSRENIDLSERIIKIIEIKEKELNTIKKKYLMLLKKYDTYYHKFSQENLFSKKSNNQTIKDEQKSSFQDLLHFQTFNYNILIKKAKYPGLVFFRKLLKYYLILIKLYSNEFLYSKAHPEELEEIITFSMNAGNYPKYNNHILNRHILKLLQLYEYICDYIDKKNQSYKLEEKNLIIMKRQQDIISDKRKVDNARTLRKLIEKVKIDNDKLLIEKWKIPSKYIERRAYIDKYRRDLIKAKSKEITIKKRKSLKKKNRMDYDLEQFLDN